jgi:hypothetical protein
VNDVNDFIAHHGVKGMKWGVRKDQHRTYSENASTTTENMVKRAGSTVQMTRYFSKGGVLKKQQNYNEDWYNKLEDGKEFIEKGATMNRIVRGVDDRALNGRLYVSTLASDNDMYKAVIPAVQKKFAFGQKEYHSVYQVELETKKRLAMPSQKERIDVFIETIQTPAGREWMKRSGYSDQITELNAKEQGLKAYKKFNKVAGNQDLKVTDVYFNKVRARGYDAILDDNDAGVWSKKPTILLSARQTVRVTDVKQLTADDINAAQRRVLANREFNTGRRK